MMISGDRKREAKPYLSSTPLRSLRDHPYIYPALRQGLHRWLRQRPPGRVLLPEYVPEGIHAPFTDLGWKTAYYPVPLGLRLDRSAVAARSAGMEYDIAVVIHCFGVCIPDNVDLLRELCGSRTLVFEDFAHTVWDRRLAPSGDVCGFSYTKALGVTAGSQLWFRDQSLAGRDEPGDTRAGDRRLCTLLRRQLTIEHLCATTVRSRIGQAVLLRATSRARAYYPFLSGNYSQLWSRCTAGQVAVLERVDFDRVADRRREIARHYARVLDPQLLLPVHREDLERSALLGFPVQVRDRERFHSNVYRRGVRGVVLKSRWWPALGLPHSELYLRHYLLPVNHHLTDSEVERVADAASEAVA